MEILTVHVHRYIPEAKGTVTLPLALFTIHSPQQQCKYWWLGFVDVFQKWRELFPSPWNWSQSTTPMEIPTIHVRRCIPEGEGIVPLLLALFTIQNTNGNIDGLKTIDVFQRRRELFPFSYQWWQLKLTEWVSSSRRNYRRTANSNVLVINASLTV